MAKAVDARMHVHTDGNRANKLRQLPGRLAAEQVHLEEPVLRMHHPQAIGKVGPAPTVNRWHAARIPLNADGVSHAFYLKRAIDLGQARGEYGSHIEPAAREEEH